MKYNKLYQDYLKTDKWKLISQTCKDLANNKCSKCESTKILQAHHLNYDNVGDEKQSDLQCLCTECHNIIHNGKLVNKNIKGGFNMIYHKAYEDIMEEVINSKKELKLFNWITNKFTYQRIEVPLPFTEVSFISKRQFSEMIKKLVELKYIQRISKGLYRLNPFIYLPYRSDATQLQQEWNDIIFFEIKN